jgi:hypothetical protein
MSQHPPPSFDALLGSVDNDLEQLFRRAVADPEIAEKMEHLVRQPRKPEKE